MIAALAFRKNVAHYLNTEEIVGGYFIRCTLRGSLAATGKGHATDQGITLGLHGYRPEQLTTMDVSELIESLWRPHTLFPDEHALSFSPEEDIVFNYGKPLKAHPNGMIWQMLSMASKNGLSIAQLKRKNEQVQLSDEQLVQGLDSIWTAMESCIVKGLHSQGILPGKLKIERRAASLYKQLLEHVGTVDVSEWLCAYAMAVNEENAAGHAVVTAPTNGAAGVIPAVLYYFIKHEKGNIEQVRTFLLTAAAIGGLIKHRSSISGAEVGCQGEVGSAASMAAAGLCAVRGGTPEQIENAAEIALEHHLGLTCDPVGGLVQVPCIERNGFGAIKAYTAASLALRGSGSHFMPLDSCIAAMKKTGEEMSHKYKETALGGLAVSITEC
jgi:L-serine dehydratase